MTETPTAPLEKDYTLPLTSAGPDQVPRKPLGRTGEQVSVMGLGGASLGSASSLEEARQILNEALDAGVNFLDNAWEYGGGRAEDWMGQVLEGRRDQVLLMTKVCTHGRDKAVALRQLEDSLRRLRTDHLDVWQIHECIYWNDPDWHFAAGGAVEALLQAKEQGKTRFIGFTGHKHPGIHLKMLEMADRHGVQFDTLQMPLNAFDATFQSFEREVLPEALRRGMGALGMKSLGGGAEPIKAGAITAEEALRYAMSLPVSTTISGIDSLDFLRRNLKVARGFQPMSPDEMEALRRRVASMAADGRMELYKTSQKYDADTGRKQHGFPGEDEMKS